MGRELEALRAERADIETERAAVSEARKSLLLQLDEMRRAKQTLVASRQTKQQTTSAWSTWFCCHQQAPNYGEDPLAVEALEPEVTTPFLEDAYETLEVEKLAAEEPRTSSPQVELSPKANEAASITSKSHLARFGGA